MGKKLSLKPKNSDFMSLAVGLFGLVATIVTFLISVTPTSSIGVSLGCSVDYGCGILGLILAAGFWFLLVPIFLKLYLFVRNAFIVVIFSSIGLFILYLLTGYWIDTWATIDNLPWIVLGFAVAAGAFFMITNGLINAVTKRK